MLLLLFPLLSEAITAKYRPVTSWFKRYCIFFTTIRTGYWKRLSLSTTLIIVEICTGFYPAIFTTKRCAKTFFLVKSLFICSPGKVLTAVFALNCLILLCHLGFTPFIPSYALCKGRFVPKLSYYTFYQFKFWASKGYSLSLHYPYGFRFKS